MKVVVVTGAGPEHRFVTNQIAAENPVHAVLVCDPPKRRSWKRMLLRSPVRFASKFARHAVLWLTGDSAKRHTSIQEVLGESSRAFSSSLVVLPCGRPNAGVLAQKVREIAPDVIAIYGTGMVGPEVLSEARIVALNMHTGLSPWYRGAACAFWPIVNKEFDKLGATVHECTAALDGGEVYFQKRIEVRKGDNLHKVFARAVEAGAAGYADVVTRACTGELVGAAQDLAAGREYSGGMLGIWAELTARKELRRFIRAL